MRIKIYSIVFGMGFGVTNPALSADTMLFDANGRRLNPPEEPSIQYQWIDPKTGQIVTREYPAANLQMHQVERRGNIVILEVLGKHKFADAVNLNTPKSVEVAQDKETAAEKCLSKIKGSYDWKDSNIGLSLNLVDRQEYVDFVAGCAGNHSINHASLGRVFYPMF